MCVACCLQAKVILSVRDSFDAWYSSCLDTIYPVVEVGGWGQFWA